MQRTFDDVVLFARTGLNPRTNFKLGKGTNTYITIKNIRNNELVIDSNTDVVDDEAIKLIHKRSQIKKGDVLFASIGRIGDMYIIPEEPQGWDINESVFAFTLNTDIIRQKYFYYLFKHQDTLDYLTKNSSGSTFKSIKMNQLKRMEFDIPSMERQDEIVAILDKLQSIIAHRKQQLLKLDELVKARFVEMFMGKDYPIITLDSLSLGKGEYGAQSAAIEYDAKRPRYVRITDINDDGTLNNDVVSSSNLDDDIQYKLSYGDFLFARMGATVGKTYAYKSGNQIYAGYLIRYKLDLERILPDYLYSYTRLNEYWEWVKLNQSGAAQPGINAKKYGSLLIPIAPIEEQRAFAAFSNQTDKSKFDN